MKKIAFVLSLLALAACVKDLPYENPNPDPGTTPGTDPVVTKTIFINEVNCGSKEFEIYNASDAAVDIAGYTFTKDDGSPWVVPAGKGNIPAKGYRVYVAKNADVNEGPSFGLSGTKGFKLCLYKNEDTSEANLVDMCDNSASAENFKTVDDGKSLGRKTDGADEWVIFDTPTLGASNGAAPVPEGRICINEVNCGSKEFEIYNGTSKAVDIAGYTFTKDDGSPWVVPAGKGNIPAKGYRVYVAKNADVNEGPSFGLSGTKGFKLCLYKNEDTSEANLVDKCDNSASAENFKTVEDGKSLGRKTDGADEWVIFDTPTIGSANK